MSDGFFNNLIEVEDLPRLPEEHFEPLDPAYLRSKFVADGVTAAVVLLVGMVATTSMRSAGAPIWIPIVGTVTTLALIAVTAVLQALSVNHLGYLVRDHDLSFRRGVISRSTQTIPYNRVQHVGIDRGPVERLFGLATLQLRSAGGVIGIEGLAAADANRLKDLVVARAGMDDAP